MNTIPANFVLIKHEEKLLNTKLILSLDLEVERDMTKKRI